MPFVSAPLYPGDMYDSALRLAAIPDAPHAAAQASARTQASPKWRQVLELGWQGVLVPEELGGAAAALSDLAAIVEAAAHAGQGLPLTDRCGIAPVLLTHARSHPAAALLAKIAAGSASACAVLDAEPHAPGGAASARLGTDGALRGRLAAADLSEPATHVVFPVCGEASGELALVLLPLERLAGRARHYAGMDGRQFTDFTLHGVPAGPDEVVMRGAAAEQAVASASHAGGILGCVQAVGAAGAMIELTIDYLNTRTQFDVRLSSFQALRHRVVEMYVAYENMSGLVRRLVHQAEETGLAGYPREVALAKLYAASVARGVAEGVIQLHGGMGMTWDMPAARLAMQALAASLQYGDRAQCLDWLIARSAEPLAA
jgi:alkylation response protein AidB-like acyl-CoA dehydrogenase